MGEMLTLKAEDGSAFPRTRRCRRASRAARWWSCRRSSGSTTTSRRHRPLRRRRLRRAGARDLRPRGAGLRDGLHAGDIEQGRAVRRQAQPGQLVMDVRAAVRSCQGRAQGRRGRLLPGRHARVARRHAHRRRRGGGGLLRRRHRRDRERDSRAARCCCTSARPTSRFRPSTGPGSARRTRSCRCTSTRPATASAATSAAASTRRAPSWPASGRSRSSGSTSGNRTEALPPQPEPVRAPAPVELPSAMSRGPLAILLDSLDLAGLDDDRFEGRSAESHPATRLRRRIAGPGARRRSPHRGRAELPFAPRDLSLPGDPARPIEYRVRRVRDGRRFAQRQVTGLAAGPRDPARDRVVHHGDRRDRRAPARAHAPGDRPGRPPERARASSRRADRSAPRIGMATHAARRRGAAGAPGRARRPAAGRPEGPDVARAIAACRTITTCTAPCSPMRRT